MAATQAGVVLQHIRELAQADVISGLSDAELLGRYMGSGDGAAFAALVKRHGPLVLGVCRRVLGNHADAEDAFQAAFLVLARKAAAIARSASLPCWLYQVAYRTALKAKLQAATRHKHEQRSTGRAAPDPLAEITGRELLGVLDEELQALSERHRAPLVLCYLEGHTCDEAARQLGCSPRTLKRWLDQARHCLGRRLARRGLSLPAALLTGGLAAGAVRAAVPARLVADTAAAGLRTAAPGVAAAASAAVTLAEAVLRGASTSWRRVAGLFLLVGGMVAVAAGGLAGAGPGGQQDPPVARPQLVAVAPPFRPLVPAAWAGDAKPTPGPRAEDKADAGTVTVSGRVVNTDGKPLVGAPVAVVGRAKNHGRGGDLLTEGTRVLAQGKTDAEGRYRLAARGATFTWFSDLYLLARAPGHGVGLKRVSPSLSAAEVTLQLRPERVARGRLVDLQGQPAAGVKIQVQWIGQSRNGNSEGVHFAHPPQELGAWPAAVQTDAQGKYAVHGLSASEEATLFAEGDRYAPQAIRFDGPAFLLGINRSLAPAQLIEGRVLQGDTGKPVPHALLAVYASDREYGSFGGLGGKADAEGRFRLNPYSGKWFTVSAHPPNGEPYLAVEQRFKWETGKVRRRLDVTLPRGVLVRGQVTEAGSGKPVARAAVQYYPQESASRKLPKGIISGWQGIEVSKDDGTFQISVLPGPGHLLIMGQEGQYVHEEIGNSVLYNGRPGGTRYYPDAMVKLALPKEARVHDVAVKLRRGLTVKGQLVGPDGQPVGKALMICRLNVSALSPYWRFPVEVHDGRFELPGLDKSCPVSFLQAEKGWGATVQLSGKQAGKEVTVKLQPCGRAVARYVDAAGKPVSGRRAWIDIVVTKGAYRYDAEAGSKGLLGADEELLCNVDRHNYWQGPMTDADGRCSFPALIPGITYRLTNFVKGMHAVAREFTAESGKTFDAGNITVER